MYGTTTEFKELVRTSHQVITRAEVWQGDNKLATLEPLDGSTEDDSRRAVRRTASVRLFSPRPTKVETPVYANYGDLGGAYANYTQLGTIYSSYGSVFLIISTQTTYADDGIVPDDAFDILAPFGNELRLWRGIRVETTEALTYSDIAEDYATYTDIDTLIDTYGALVAATEVVVQDEMVPLGVFLITKVDIEETAGGVNLSVEGQDRSLKISRNRWTDTYTVPKGTNVVTAITNLLQNRWDDIQISFGSSDETVGKSVFGTETDNDPWQDARKLAESAGLDLYFDGDGIARLEPVPTYQEATPVETYLENEEAMILNAKRSLVTDQTYNGVIAFGMNSGGDQVYRQEVWDEDPESPTYRYGKFGSVPRFFSSPMIQSNASALKAANSILNRSKGAQESISWTQIADPSLEAGDLIQFQNTATKVDHLLIIDRMTIPLQPSAAMSCIARTIKTMRDDTVVGDDAE